MTKLTNILGVLIVFSINTPIFAADESAGELAYAQCIGCHSFGYNRTGPDHCGLNGRLAGTVSGYGYSVSMRESGIVWSQQTLDEFLSSPLSFIPATTMGFAGINDSTQRKILVEYIIEQSSSLECKQ